MCLFRIYFPYVSVHSSAYERAVQLGTSEISSAERGDDALNLSKRAGVIMRQHSLCGATAWYCEVCCQQEERWRLSTASCMYTYAAASLEMK